MTLAALGDRGQMLAPDAWDDTALIKAWDNAMKRYKVRSKECHGSDEGAS